MLTALGLIDGGAVLVDTGTPLPVPVMSFLDEQDADDFLAWIGPAATHLEARMAAPRWKTVRGWKPCASCGPNGTGRVPPGDVCCERCGRELAIEEG
jgi:hypothetical protein